VYLPGTIKAYQFIKESRQFITDSLIWNGNLIPVFIEVIQVGQFRIYQFMEKSLKNHFFINRSGDTKRTYLPFKRFYQKETYDHGLNKYTKYYTRTTTFHVDSLKMLLSDAPNVFTQIENMGEPDLPKLKKLLINYQQSIELKGTGIVLKDKEKTYSYYLIPWASVAFNRNNLYSKNLVYGGVSAVIKILPRSDNWYLKVGFGYSRNNDFDNPGTSNFDRKKFFYNVPIQVEYRFAKKLIQPALAYGICYNSLYETSSIAFSAPVYINLSSRIAINISPEVNLFALRYFPLVPVPLMPIISYNLCAGIQIKL